MDVRVEKILDYFRHLSPADLDAVGSVYADDARFKDPFNDVRGTAAIHRVYAHMFATLDGPRFVIHDVLVDGDQCFLTWDFLFRRKGSEAADWLVHGSSHLKLAPDGRILLHRDYWDAAEELYEKLPLLGALLRAIRRRLSA